MSRPLKVNIYNLYDTSENITDVLTDSLVSYGDTAKLPSSSVSNGEIFLNTENSTSVMRFNNAWQPLDNGGNEVAFGTIKPATAVTGQIFLDTSAGIPYWGNNGTWNTFLAETPVTSFSPASVAPLAAWFDAMDANSMELNGNVIRRFYDKAGYILQNLSSGNPQYITTGTVGGITGRKWLDISSNTASSINGAINYATDVRRFTFYIVGINSGNSAGSYLFAISPFSSTITSTGSFAIGTNSTPGALSIVRGNGGTISEIYSAPNAAPVGQPFICGVTFTGITDSSSGLVASIYINGTKVTDISGSLLISSVATTRLELINTMFSIGSRYTPTNTGFWKGYFGEALLYADPLTDIERQQVEGYLAHKWGIQSRLPAGHTYKNAAP